MTFSRRSMLARMGFGLTLLPAMVRAPRSIVGMLLSAPEGPLMPAKPMPANPFRKNGKTLVAIVHGNSETDVGIMLAEGLKLIGGLERLELQGKRVLIKPNVVNNRPPPVTSNPHVIAAVVRAVKDAGARDIIVADGSGIIRLPTSDNLVATGIKQAAESAGAGVVALEDEPWVRVEPSAAQAMPHYYVSRRVYEADVFINLPVIKTHKFANYSCGLKNLVGITHPRYRPSLRFFSTDWHERIAELNLAVHPHLTIADGTMVMIAGGPTSGTAAKADILLLSGDRVALDAVAVALLRTYGTWPRLREKTPWQQRQIARAIELGLGVGDPTRLELVTRSVSAANAGFDRLVARIRRDLAV
jgi:uncharacterized protein (DUF362 family)